MNIHFTDKKLFEDLTNNTVVRVKVGSHMYSLNNENSDVDFLYIYLESNRDSFLWEHHQLQFKEEGVDHNFTTLQGFIRNVLTGDSTINFETLNSDALRDSDLRWLWELRGYFGNYNIIKSYLGLVRRDHKVWEKDTYNGSKHLDQTNKKIMHVVRGVISANNILNGRFSNDFTKTSTFELGFNDYELLRALKNGLLRLTDLTEVVRLALALMEESRKILTTLHDQKNISIFMDVTKLKETDEKLIGFASKHSDGLRTLDYGDLFYRAMEEDIKYSK